MASGPVAVKFGAETDQLRQGVNQAAYAVRDASRMMSQALKQMADTASSASSQAEQSINKMTKSISDGGATGKIDALKNALKGIPTALGGLAGVTGILAGVTAAVAGLAKVGSEAEQSLFSMSKTFGAQTTAMVAQSQQLAARMNHAFSSMEIQQAFVRTADAMARYGIQGTQYVDLVARAADIAAAKNIDLEQSMTRLEAAMRGEAESSEYLGVTLNDTYMKTTAFGGALKETWEVLDENSKAALRYNEMLDQTGKYSGAAADSTTTFSGAMSALWNTLVDRVAPALAKVSSMVGEYIGLINKAMSAPTLDQVMAGKRGAIEAGINSPFSNMSNRELQEQQMDLLDQQRAKQAGKIGTTGEGVNRQELAKSMIKTDPEKQLKWFKEQLQAEQDQMILSGNIKDLSAKKEVEFWQDKIKTAKEGSKEYATIQHELAMATKQMIAEDDKAAKASAKGGGGGKAKGGGGGGGKADHGAFEEEMADMRLQLEMHRENAEERVRIVKQMADRTAKEYGQESKEHKNMLRQVEQETRKHGQQMQKIKMDEIESTKQIAMADMAIKEEEINTLRQLGQISAQQEVAQLRALEEEKYQIELKALQDRLALGDLDVVETQQLYKKLELLKKQHDLKMMQADKQMAKRSDKTWGDMAQGMTQQFGGAIKGVLTGTQTMGQAMSQMMSQLLDGLINKMMEFVSQWISGLVAGQAQEQAAGATSAAVGATKAGESVASIPGVGWAMLPGVVASTFGLLMGTMSSAAGGYDIPSHINPMVQAHGREMILPAHLADRVRGMTEPAGRGGGQVHNSYSIKSLDGRDVERVLKRNAKGVAGGVKRAQRDFRFRGAKA
jgi:hypothetical protein